MSRNKNPQYLAEKLRRTKIRKDKRNDNYRQWSSKANDAGRNIACVKYHGSWDDPNSPTGRSQICEMGGHCESPCNGDC